MYVERRGRVGTETDVERMAERELPGETHHHVPGLADVGEVKNQDQNGDQVVVGESGPEKRGQQQAAA